MQHTTTRQTKQLTRPPGGGPRSGAGATAAPSPQRCRYQAGWWARCGQRAPCCPPRRKSRTVRSRVAKPPLLKTPNQHDKRRVLLPRPSCWPVHHQPQARSSAASTHACLQRPPPLPAALGCLAELAAPPGPPTPCLCHDGGPARGPYQWRSPACAPGLLAERGHGAPRPAPLNPPTKHPPWLGLHQPGPRRAHSAQS